MALPSFHWGQRWVSKIQPSWMIHKSHCSLLKLSQGQACKWADWIYKGSVRLELLPDLYQNERGRSAVIREPKTGVFIQALHPLSPEHSFSIGLVRRWVRMLSPGSLLSQEKLLRSVKASRILELERVGECPVPANTASGGQFSSVEQQFWYKEKAQWFSASAAYLLHVKFWKNSHNEMVCKVYNFGV